MLFFIISTFFLTWARTGREKELLPQASNSKKQNQSFQSQLEKEIYGSLHPVTQAAAGVGVSSCLDRINQVSNFLTLDAKDGSLLFLPEKDPNKDILAVSYEAVREDNSVFYVSASFFPSEKGCAAVYNTIEYAQESCTYIRSNLFSSLKKLGKMKNKITVLDGGTLKIFLMPVEANRCMVIKKEVVR